MFELMMFFGLVAWAVDTVIEALATGKIDYIFSYSFSRDKSPIRFWVLTSSWVIAAILCVVVMFWLIAQWVLGIGRFQDESFFSLNRSIPYMIVSILFALSGCYFTYTRFKDHRSNQRET